MSAVWEYFSVENSDSVKAICKICKLEVSRGGTNKAHFNTTNLIRHLQKSHTVEYGTYKKRTKPQQQQTLAEVFQKKDKLPRNGEKSRNITRKIVEYIALDDQPISVVENVGFRRLMDYLEPKYELPSRHYISDTALPELYNKICECVQASLSKATYISFTTDIWSSDVCPMSLLSLTAHWIDSSFKLMTAVLHAREFRGSHTAEHVRQEIEEMIEGWKIEKQRVHVVLRDNASNMRKAMDEMGVRSLGCIAHTLHLIVHEGLLSQRSVCDTLTIARKIVGHFKHSPLAYSRLEDIQVELKMPRKRLLQDVQVRWNSTLYMLQSLLDQKRPLSLYASEHNLPSNLTSNQWMLAEKTVQVLAPFEEITRAVSAETATCADVIPAITVLKRALAREENDTGIKTMKSTLLEAVERRFSHVETESLYYIATLVDPRYKDRYFSSPANLKTAKESLLQMVEKMQVKTDEETEQTAQRKVPEATTTQLGTIFDEILEESEMESRSATSSSVFTEVQNYLTEPTIARSVSPLDYWRAHAAQSPTLAAVATRFLCAPCTSVDSERLFSATSNIMDEKRNRLSADMTEKLVFIKKNFSLIL